MAIHTRPTYNSNIKYSCTNFYFFFIIFVNELINILDSVWCDHLLKWKVCCCHNNLFTQFFGSLERKFSFSLFLKHVLEMCVLLFSWKFRKLNKKVLGLFLKTWIFIRLFFKWLRNVLGINSSLFWQNFLKSILGKFSRNLSFPSRILLQVSSYSKI